jgi:peptidylprolyl isomerase
VTYIDAFTSNFRPRSALALTGLAATMLIAGCGGSGNSSTITVGLENKSDSALIKQNEGPAKKTSTTPTTSAKTPTSGPLSTEPKVTPPTGAPPKKLEIKDLITGTGAEVKPGASVTVNYVGVLFKGGKVFDASWKRHEPSTFSLSGVIPGWTKGIPGMKVGGRRELVIPAVLAYGAQGSGSIPPNAPLVFVIDLLGT